MYLFLKSMICKSNKLGFENKRVICDILILFVYFFCFYFLSAKFLKLEQLDQDLDAAETVGISVDGTGQVGTFFYTAPEIEQGWPKINEKVSLLLLSMN